MNPMLHAILQWQQLKQFHPPANPWLAWAQTLISRFESVPYRSATLGMMLEQRLTSIYLINQRWQHHIWQLQSNVKVTITPLEREEIHTHLPLASQSTVHHDQPKAIQPLAEAVPAAQRVHLRSESNDRSSANSTSSRSTDSLAQSSLPWQTLTPKIVQGIHHRQSVFFKQNLFTQASYHSLRPLMRERQRIEEMTRRTLVVRQQHDTASTRVSSTTIDSSTSDLHPAMPSPTKAGATGLTASTLPPEINIDLLTEQIVRQIDRRFTAHRERLGKPF